MFETVISMTDGRTGIRNLRAHQKNFKNVKILIKNFNQNCKKNKQITKIDNNNREKKNF